MFSTSLTTILLISGDHEIQYVLHRSLPAHGFRLQDSSSIEPDPILLDLDYAGVDGIDLIRQIRSRTRTPLIVLCCRDGERATVAALIVVRMIM